MEILRHLCSPPLGVWVRPPLLHINTLPPFSVTNGTLSYGMATLFPGIFLTLLLFDVSL